MADRFAPPNRHRLGKRGSHQQDERSGCPEKSREHCRSEENSEPLLPGSRVSHRSSARQPTCVRLPRRASPAGGSDIPFPRIVCSVKHLRSRSSSDLSSAEPLLTRIISADRFPIHYRFPHGNLFWGGCLDRRSPTGRLTVCPQATRNEGQPMSNTPLTVSHPSWSRADLTDLNSSTRLDPAPHRPQHLLGREEAPRGRGRAC
jgi:hypothetical protein